MFIIVFICNFNIFNNSGYYPFHVASKYNSFLLLSWLWENICSNINILTQERVGKSESNIECVQVLSKYYLKLSISSQDIIDTISNDNVDILKVYFKYSSLHKKHNINIIQSRNKVCLNWSYKKDINEITRWKETR